MTYQSSVVLMRERIDMGKRKMVPYLLRWEIWKRDGGVCGICEEAVEFPDMHADHIVRVVDGGTNAPDNLRTTHKECNQSRPKRLSSERQGDRMVMRALYVWEADWNWLETVAPRAKSAVLRDLLTEHRRQHQSPTAPEPNPIKETRARAIDTTDIDSLHYIGL